MSGSGDFGDLSLSEKSVFFEAVDSHRPNDAAPFVPLLSTAAAREQVACLLEFFARLDNFSHDPEKRHFLDAVLVLILDGSALLESDLVSNEHFSHWLTLAYTARLECGEVCYAYPLFGVINRLLSLVKDGSQIKKCFTYAATHLKNFDEYQKKFELSHLTDDTPLIRLVSQLLGRLGQLEDASCLEEIKEALSVVNENKSRFRYPYLKEVGALALTAADVFRRYSMYAGDVQLQRECYQQLLKSNSYMIRFILISFKVLFTTGKYPVRVAKPLIRLLSPYIRRWLEIGLIPAEPLSHDITMPWLLTAFLHVLTRLRQFNNFSSSLTSSIVTLVIWQTAAGVKPELATEIGRSVFYRTSQLLPEVSRVLLLGVPRLQQICARTIRCHLRGSISEMSGKLPLPAGMQGYVASDFLDDDLCRVKSLVADVKKIQQ